MSIGKVLGYKRENGRIGVRNHVAILALDDLSNSACEAVAGNVAGTLALPHAYGRLQFGKDLELHFRTIIGLGANPNVAAVVVIGIEMEWTNIVVEGIKKTGKPVVGFGIERNGDFETIRKASWQAKEFVQQVSDQQREEVDLSEIWISTKCGESDTTSGLASNPTVGNVFEKHVQAGGMAVFGETSEITGAEMVVKERAATPEVSKEFIRMWTEYNDMIERNKTDDLSGSQPTKGNIAGGLTTIEEKAFGNVQKIGKKIDFIGCLDYAEEPAPNKKGLYFMQSSSAAAECVTLMAAAGFVVHLFPTGQGNIIGNPVEPVVKLSANPRTVKDMAEHVDWDCSGILDGSLTLDQSGDGLIDVIKRTCNGRLTAAECLKHRELIMTRLYESA